MRAAVIEGIGIEDMVRIERARMRGLRSEQSCEGRKMKCGNRDESWAKIVVVRESGGKDGERDNVMVQMSDQPQSQDTSRF